LVASVRPLVRLNGWNTLQASTHRPPSLPRAARRPAGEGFVRASAFGHRDNILEAVERFKKVYGGKK
jgi:hypothetical protein